MDLGNSLLNDRYKLEYFAHLLKLENQNIYICAIKREAIYKNKCSDFLIKLYLSVYSKTNKFRRIIVVTNKTIY